jgi:hypothetical protein
LKDTIETAVLLSRGVRGTIPYESEDDCDDRSNTLDRSAISVFHFLLKESAEVRFQQIADEDILLAASGLES